MSAAEFARQLVVPPERITDILDGRRAITGDTALMLAHYLGTGKELWMNLQKLYESRLADDRAGNGIESLPKFKTT